jgi:hypothetical protein
MAEFYSAVDTRAMARRDGHWPDHSPFGENDADFYDITARYEETVLKQPPPDIPHPPDVHDPIGFPAWLVRNPHFRNSARPPG